MHAEEQMRQPREIVPVAQVRRKILQWIEEQRQSGYIVTRNLIIIKVKAMAAELQITRFLASNCWCTKFLQRKNLALRQKTKIAQKLPEDLDQKITNFHSFVIKSRRKKTMTLFTLGTWMKRLSGLTCHQPEL